MRKEIKNLTQNGHSKSRYFLMGGTLSNRTNRRVKIWEILFTDLSVFRQVPRSINLGVLVSYLL